MQDPAEAYFCGDDVLSIGAMSAVREAGLRCPEDIGIIGLNDMKMAAWQNIDLTTIRQPIAEIIGASIELVIATIEQPDRHPETRLFPCRVVERGTLRPLP
jgi:DNA-binding LacI/PurR family transcriptional regulator